MQTNARQEARGASIGTLSPDDMRRLGQLVTRDEHGRHFMEIESGDWLDRMEESGWIEIGRPIHHASGLSYSSQYWTVTVADEVAGWFDAYGNLLAE